MKLNLFLAAICIAITGFTVGRDSYRPVNLAPTVNMAKADIPVISVQPLTLPKAERPHRIITILSSGVTKNAAFIEAVGRAAIWTDDYKQISASYLFGTGADGNGRPLDYWVCALKIELPAGYEETEAMEVDASPPPKKGI